MNKILINLILLIIISVLPVSGQPDSVSIFKIKADSLRNNFLLFGSDELLELSLHFDISKYIRKNTKEPSQDALLTFHFSDSDSLNANIKIKYRGKFRFDNCGFPPMEINFKKQLHAYSDTDHIKKIKLVPHCDRGSLSDEYVLREYLIYKLYNVISDTSYRVRLLKMNYIDTQGKKEPATQYAFFIEPDEILSNRLKITELKIKNLTQRYIMPDIMDKVSIFNYLIANWDWNIPNLQNITVYKPRYIATTGAGIAIPYDFDLSGLVNTDYVVLPPEYGLKTSRERIFLGICRSKPDFHNDLLYFLEKKNELYSTVNDFPYLTQKSKKDIIGFLNQFFSQIENKRSLDNLLEYFLGSCKQLL